MAEHCGLGFDTANTPTKNGQAVYHSCVRVCTNEGIWVCNLVAVLVSVCPYGLRKVFKVNLVTDTGSRRYNAEVVKGALTPFKECVTFHVAFVFTIHVHLERARGAEFVDHNGVVNDQINRIQRVNFFSVTTEGNQTVAHRGKVNYGRNAGEILHQNACWTICDFTWVLTTVHSPFSEGFDVIDGDCLTIFKAQHVFQNHFQGSWQAREVAKAGFLCRRNGIIGNRL